MKYLWDFQSRYNFTVDQISLFININYFSNSNLLAPQYFYDDLFCFDM